MTKFIVKTVLDNIRRHRKEFTYNEKIQSIHWSDDPGDIAMEERFRAMEYRQAEHKLRKHKLKYPHKYVRTIT